LADSFGKITPDIRRSLVTEWIADGITHISLSALVILVKAIEDAQLEVARHASKPSVICDGVDAPYLVQCASLA